MTRPASSSLGKRVDRVLREADQSLLVLTDSGDAVVLGDSHLSVGALRALLAKSKVEVMVRGVPCVIESCTITPTGLVLRLRGIAIP